MHIRIAGNGTVSLEDAQNFRGFSIVTDTAGTSLPPAFHDMATDAGDGRWWLDADAVVGLSGHAGDDAWTARFWAMLEGAEPYGFADLAKRRVKAHVETPDRTRP